MRIQSVHDLAATARGRRLALGLTQAELASRAGLSRDWVNSFEAGKTSVELILVLRVLEALDLHLAIGSADDAGTHDQEGQADLDALLDEYRRS